MMWFRVPINFSMSSAETPVDLADDNHVEKQFRNFSHLASGKEALPEEKSQSLPMYHTQGTKSTSLAWDSGHPSSWNREQIWSNVMLYANLPLSWHEGY